jgi:FKBP-type peptidyl-prolyl cis-trans isomerase
MQLTPKRPFTWILLGIAIYTYAQHHKMQKEVDFENKQISQQNKKATNQSNTTQNKVTNNINPLDDVKVSVEPDSIKSGLADKTANYFVKEISKTRTGQAFIKALAEQSIEDKYGETDVSLVAAFEENKLIKIDKIAGKGDSVACGSEVKIHFSVNSQLNIQLNNTKRDNKPITIKVGEGSIIKGIENGILGMKKGGIRKIAIPPHLAYGDPNFYNNLIGENYSVLTNVELLEVKNGTNFKSNLKTIDLTEGRGIETVLCNSRAKVNYSTKSGVEGIFSFIPRDNTVPYGIEKGILGMKSGQKRKLEIPYEMLETEKEYKLKDVEFEEGKPFEITVEVTDIEQNQ